MSFLEVNLALWEGFRTSLLVFSVTLIFSLPLGLLMMAALRSRSRVLSGVMRVFIWLIRGTPLMLQLLVVFFAPGLLWGGTIFAQKRLLAALFTFVVNYACYFAVIFKGGIESVSQGQFEAGKVLGLTRWQTFRDIVGLQVLKHILPAISNEVITLVKDTSLVRVIAVVEIIKVAERFTSKGLIWPLFYTGAFYLVFSALVTAFFSWAERRLSYFQFT